ncbi:phenylacetic acid degradation bifunctional protein PaaZ [uncultured Roseobacter sp.]|uniref:phenylacetic acid degradation bifunctional protein PaaZ n=1 Tax=uncultured Roseobacter sp. TaxID=114847 RepID=UPI00260A1730|nr:phenylacetic acid degradation bifunctional protein PaaZ [uncultured Roseobacter sp.]
MPTLRDVESFAAGQWILPDSGARLIASAITGQHIARAGNDALDVQSMLAYARERGGPALRKLTFHDRARLIKALALHLRQHRQTLYDLSYDTGATASDHLIDVDGGIGTMLVFASKGRREMPDAHVYLDGPVEQLSREGSFLGQHIAVPLQGVALQINAYNFPVWGMLEKLAPALLAGMPVIVKPATATCYVTEACVRLLLDSGLLPPGALQLVSGGLGDMLDHLDCQDTVAFTGSATTARHLRQTPQLIAESVRFTAEQDSLNASLLGPDAGPGTLEFDLFLDEVQREITTKAGQKCTAIRRIMVPDGAVDAVLATLSQRLSQVRVGDPREKTTEMGALVSAAQKADVLEKAAQLSTEAERVCGDSNGFTPAGAETAEGAFLPPMLFHCGNPDAAQHVHDTEAFGPVSTVMGYRDLDHAVRLLNRGKGSLVASLITHDPAVARQVTLGTAAFHGRLYINDRRSMGEATGHGAPLPHMVHGGPGRAGGGEELGGIRGVLHHMQRTAIQGSPDMLSAITGQWVPGATTTETSTHPFTRPFCSLHPGETLAAGPRTVTLEDIETFAHFTGDTFYAHMDDTAAAANPFFPGRVAHGYLLLSFAAGLFVEPAPGPVLANTGLDNLRFLTPVSPGDSLSVQLTVKAKTPRNAQYGEVRWHVRLSNQDGAAVAEYDLLTMNAH